LQAPQVKAVLVVLLLLPAMGGWNARVPSRAKLLGFHEFSEKPDLAALRVRAAALFHVAKYTDAADAYQLGYREAVKQGETASALRFLNSVGAARLAGLRYRDAARVFLHARQLAASRRDWEMAGVVSLNLATLYLEMGNPTGAAAETVRAVAALDQAPRSRYRAQALAQKAKLKSEGGDSEGAISAFFAAIREADRQGDLALKAQVTNRLGHEYLDRGRLADAECAMTEAFRLRVLGRSREIGQSYHALALLKIAQGEFQSAEVLLDRAMAETGRNPGRVPDWEVFRARGDLRLRQHRVPDAVRAFRTAIGLARVWRQEVLPADLTRDGAESRLAQIFSSFIRTAGELYLETGRQSLAREAFAAADQSRSASLRAALARDGHWRDRLPPEYGQTLAELRFARTALLRSGSAESRERLSRLRNSLAEMELRAGLEAESESVPQPTALDTSEALISFHLDEPHSYSWVVTKEGIEMHRLAGASRIRDLAHAFQDALRRDSTDCVPLGERLYAELFGQTGPRALAKPRWLLAVEDVLLGVPFPALVLPATGPKPSLDRIARPLFLVERHSVTIVPDARVFGGGRRVAAHRGRFVGVGDPVYNGADERWGGPRGRDTSLQLPRLAGSALEIRAAAAAWRDASAPLLLEGPAATRQALMGALTNAPGVIHFATHVLRSQENPARRLIPLSLLPGGDPELVGPEDIASWRLREPAIVVISGCSSGVPERRIPAFNLVASPLEFEQHRTELGLVGLARAWLSAGARAVAVTLWPTPDGSGEFFRSFYRHLSEPGGPDAAAALEHAQIDMLNSKTWRSVPRHWAAYLIVGRG
jgi:CHAT domain-containing protein